MKDGEAPIGPEPSPAPSNLTVSSPPPVERLVGLDLARGLAVLGMFATHIGPDLEEADGGGAVVQLTHGRSAALFALLAGMSLVIIGGRRQPRTGRAGRQAMAKIAIRAVVLLALGTALTAADAPVDVILASYAVYFLMALPLLRLPAKRLAIIATVLAVAGPLLSFGLRALLERETWPQTIAHNDPLKRLSGQGVLDLLLTGPYPAMTCMAFVVSGMALGRLDLAAGRVRRRLAVLGPALALIGYGASWLAFRLFPGVPAAIEASARQDAHMPTWWTGPENGTVDTDTPSWLLVASPHSGTVFEIVGNIGVAITILMCALAVVDRLPRVRRALRAVIAVGTMSLSVYVGHIIAIMALGADDTSAPFPVLVAFIAAALVLAVLWSRRFRRGPLEYLLNAATRPARHIK